MVMHGEGMEKSSLRLRLSFKNGGGHILSKTQKSQGLKKSWILLQPKQEQLHTIADLSAHIIQAFRLRKSCPDGLLLSIDGFVLPHFQSICILKDNDIVSVKKKGDVLRIKGNDAADNGAEMQLVEKQPANAGILLLANEEFEKESGGYETEESDDESEEEDEGNAEDNTKQLIERNATSKKRKAPEKSQSPKKKKQRAEPPTNDKNKGKPELIESSHRGVISKKKNVAEKEKLSEHGDATTIETDEESAEESDGDVESTPSPKRNGKLQKDGQDVNGGTPVSESSRKGPSRSARRKYAKRRWLREMAKIQKKSQDSTSKEVQNWKQDHAKAEKNTSSKKVRNWNQEHAKAGKKEEAGQPKGLLHWKQSGQTDVSKASGKTEEDNSKGVVFQKPMQKGDKEDEVVPVVVRPGHIRFEPLDEDQAAQQSQLPAETFQWNGITSKKKGQKWGTNTSTFSRRNDKRETNEYAMDNEKDTQSRGHNWGKNTSSFSRRNDQWESNEDSMDIEKDTRPRGHDWGTNTSSVPQRNESSELNGQSMNIDKDILPKKPVDFDKLPPLSVPKEGDVIAYRLLELSSSWTPEITSFRVGKISWYNSRSGKIKLTPVQEFPIDFEESNEDESPAQPVSSLYNEDGSLEIDFKALLDVRVLNNGNIQTENTVTDSDNRGPVSSENGETPVLPSNKQTYAPESGGDNQDKSARTPGAENGVNLWEQFSEVLSSKKEELSKENGWGKPSPAKSSGSIRPWRGGAVGPTMAFLRSEKRDKK